MSDKPKKPKLSQRLKDLLSEYGSIALVTYLATSVLVFIGAAIAISAGFGSESASGFAGTAAAAWVVLKLTQPFRILGVLAITPVIAAVWHKIRGVPMDQPLFGGHDDDGAPDDEEE